MDSLKNKDTKMSLSSFKKILMLFLVTTIFLLPLSVLVINSRQVSLSFISPKIVSVLTKAVRTNSPYTKCHDVLSHMTKGTWKTRPLTKKENEDMIAFLYHAHARYRLPGNYERKDKLCGNVTYTGSKVANWFRALCDPRGPNPCCYHNQCAMKTVEECVCKDCYDMRHMKHAEYSSWIPSHPGCPYKVHSPQEACDILRGATVVFAGDSLVRHVYTAMLLIVTGNMKDGAMQQNVKKDQRTACAGMYMFTEKVCRLILNGQLRACNGTVNLRQLYYYNADFGPRLKTSLLSMKEKSVAFTGIGIHNGFNEKPVITKYLKPTLMHMKGQNKTWPRFLWAANHAPGILKSPIVLSQTYDKVKQFNAKMEPFLKSWNIPIFDSFNLTDGMMSFDGEHYGMGINIVKANILLSYIQELRADQKW